MHRDKTNQPEPDEPYLPTEPDEPETPEPISIDDPAEAVLVKSLKRVFEQLGIK